MNRLLFSISILLVVSAVGSADTSVYTEGTYTNPYGVTYVWRGGYDVHVDAYSHSTENFRNTTQNTPECVHASRVRIRDDDNNVIKEVISGYVEDITCDENPNPSSVSVSCDIGHGWEVLVGRDSNFFNCYMCYGGSYAPVSATFSSGDKYTVSGATACLDDVTLYIHDGTDYQYQNYTVLGSSYSFPIFENHDYRLIFSNGVYYDFTCTGDEAFDYDACIYVYGYTCGVDSTRLYKYDGGWVLDESVSHSGDYNTYGVRIDDGEDYLISFAERGFVCHNETFSCTGSDVPIDFDRCQWVYPPSAGPEVIYIWAGYDYNIVIMKDAHGNFVENSQVAIYDKTSNTHIYKWTDTPDGYILLGTKFDTDHDVQITARTFDGTFTLNTVFPANGTPIIGEEDIAITNWTIPIMYNLGLQPVDQTGKPVFDVFCGLVEYTPLNPLSFWGMDLSDRGYVPVTNCSGFAMCDIIAEKDGYTDYNVSMLNWTSRSAMMKDYRHDIVMEEEQ